MQRATEEKIILVTRPTRLTELKRRFNTANQARFYVKHLGQDFSDYDHEETQYAAAVAQATQVLAALGRVQQVDRSFLPNFVFGPSDVVVVLGQDGLVANTVKYLNGQPVVGVNPDPARWDGQLLPFQLPDLSKVVLEVIQRRRPVKTVTMAKATLNTGEVMYAVNDLFIGPRTHTSARYQIRLGEQTEFQSSSGVIVSTGLGSTGWLKSLLTGAAGIVQGVGTAAARAEQQKLARDKADLFQKKFAPRKKFSVRSEFPWDSNYLCFTVREPYPSKTTDATIVSGRVTPTTTLQLTSQMPENGVIFSDGIENDFLEFRSGTCAVISVAEKSGRLVV